MTQRRLSQLRVSIPEGRKEQLDAIAAKTGITPSVLAKLALNEYLDRVYPEPEKKKEPILEKTWKNI